VSQSEQASQEKNSNANAQPISVGLLILLGVVSAVIYYLLNSLSWHFTYNSVFAERPIISVLQLFTAAFLAYAASIYIAKRAVQNETLIGVIIGFALLFRVVMLFSYPIQEVDIYRYMWDGEVQTQGVSPFKFSPYEVWAADTDTNLDGVIDNAEAAAARFTDSNRDGVWDQLVGAPQIVAKNPDLKKLVAHRDSDPSVEEILHRVHYGELPTIYPPTSQLVFRVSAMITPSGISVIQRVWVMKAVLIAFDLGVLILLIKMLALCRMPVGLSVAYGWCPLVMKEIANSGHLDAIAVFLSVLAIYLLVRLVSKPASDAPPDRSSRFSYPVAVLAGLVLAAAVGAKLYPIVLAPLLFAGILRRCSWYASIGAAVAFAAATFLLVLPILPSGGQTTLDEKRAKAAQQTTDGTEVVAETTGTDPSAGLTKFLKYWEMNDFIFMIVVENLKVRESKPAIWFSFAPRELREAIVDPVSKQFDIPISETPFRITRALTSLTLLLLALWFVWRADSKSRSSDGLGNGRFYCEAAFLSMAWFWLLLPTQNPWYWLWALPFLPFMRNRAWFAVSGIIMVYYFRFWMEYHWTGFSVWETPYQGVAFYDFVLTWFEFAPWFIWLAVEGCVWLFVDSVRTRRSSGDSIVDVPA